MEKQCKDCLTELVARPITKMRPAPHPGPRCATHHRVEALRRKKRAQEKRRQDTYGLSPEEHAVLLALQGGACAICQKVRGVTRALAVDHDHAQAALDGHDPAKGCKNCTRGLLCKRCNRVLGEYRDDADVFQRAAEYLRNPPTARARSAWADSASRSASPGSSAPGVTGTASSSERT